MIGIDVSVYNTDRYPNGKLPWDKIRAAGAEFVIVRTGAGISIVDETFAQTVRDAKLNGLKVGAYHYSYALNAGAAMQEAILCKEILRKAGLELDMPVFFDMEDADQYKYRHGFTFSKHYITSLCRAWLQAIQPLHSGLYASLSWFEDYIDWQSLVNEFQIPVWNAQYSHNDYLQGYMWQFTDNLKIDGNSWDANVLYDTKHKAGLDPWKLFIQS